jgi:tetratricopeptide (TPR) repeat protein
MAAADELGLVEARAGSRASSVYAHLHAGRLAEALALAEEGEEITQGDLRVGTEIAGFSYLVYHANVRSVLLALMGRLDEARRALERGQRLARESGIPENLVWAGANQTLVADYLGESTIGDLGDARAAARQSVEIAEEFGSAFSRVLAYNALGTAHLVCRDWQEAERALSTALELLRVHRTGRETEAGVLLRLARVRLGRGDAAEARRVAEQAVALARDLGQAAFETHSRIALAEALCASEGAKARAAIQEELDRASELVEQTGGRAFAPWIAEARAELARVLGDEVQQGRDLREAHRLYTEIGATGHAKRLAQELGL